MHMTLRRPIGFKLYVVKPQRLGLYRVTHSQTDILRPIALDEMTDEGLYIIYDKFDLLAGYNGTNSQSNSDNDDCTYCC